MTIRLLVIDGYPLTRFGLAQLTAQHSGIEVVGEAGTVAEALAEVKRLRPDVVTVDVTLPDGNGLTLARELRDRWASLGIVVLTSRDEDDVLFRALDAKASAFVSKTAPLPEIVTAVRHAAVAASSFTAVDLAGALTRLREARERTLLTPREMEVLRQLQGGRSIPEVARALHMSTSTAKTHVARLYEKLEVSNRAQALMVAWERGLVSPSLASTTGSTSAAASSS